MKEPKNRRHKCNDACDHLTERMAAEADREDRMSEYGQQAPETEASRVRNDLRSEMKGLRDYVDLAYENQAIGLRNLKAQIEKDVKQIKAAFAEHLKDLDGRSAPMPVERPAGYAALWGLVASWLDESENFIYCGRAEQLRRILEGAERT